eukprot:gnl/Chilomastix_cuspidata/3081.p1 GENE.gnl/Chilomastix_cuspidata/3081~~gnl/Chilomastix_cuspidata/3081.p1  ORF type:complete len:1834 (+),score=585.64 gnl/Chilomastix_cuspidata/3081:352-5502(+)
MTVYCVDCWEPEKHVGHKFCMMMISGGMCDCGDNMSLHPSGNCSHHKGIGIDDDPSNNVPAELRRAYIRTIHALAFLSAALVIAASVYLNFSSAAHQSLLVLMAFESGVKSDFFRRILSFALLHQLVPPTQQLGELEHAAPLFRADGLEELDLSSLLQFLTPGQFPQAPFFTSLGSFSFITLTLGRTARIPLFRYNAEQTIYSALFNDDSKSLLLHQQYIKMIMAPLASLLSESLMSEPYYKRGYFPIFTQALPLFIMFHSGSLCFPMANHWLARIATDIGRVQEPIPHERLWASQNKMFYELFKMKKISQPFSPFLPGGSQLFSSHSITIQMLNRFDAYDRIVTTDLLKFLALSRPGRADGPLALETKMKLVSYTGCAPGDIGILKSFLAQDAQLYWNVDFENAIMNGSMFREKVFGSFPRPFNSSFTSQILNLPGGSHELFYNRRYAWVALILHISLMSGAYPLRRIATGNHVSRPHMGWLYSCLYALLYSLFVKKIGRGISVVPVEGNLKKLKAVAIEVPEGERLSVIRPVFPLLDTLVGWLCSDFAHFGFWRLPSGAESLEPIGVDILTDLLLDTDRPKRTFPAPFGTHCAKSAYKAVPSEPSKYAYTFHIYLHRLLSAVAHTFKVYRNISFWDIVQQWDGKFAGVREDHETGDLCLEDTALFSVPAHVALATHPMRTFFIAKTPGLFIRNGISYYEEMSRHSEHIFFKAKSEPLDLDLNLLQVAASSQAAGAQSDIVRLLLRTFGLDDCISTNPFIFAETTQGDTMSKTVRNFCGSQENLSSVIDSAMVLLCSIFRDRRMNSARYTKRQLFLLSSIQALASAKDPLPHKKVVENFTQKSISMGKAKVAIRQFATELEQGDQRLFALKDSMWPRVELFDPFFSSNMREKTIENFTRRVAENKEAVEKSRETPEAEPIEDHFPGIDPTCTVLPSLLSLPAQSCFSPKLGVDPLLLLPCTAEAAAFCIYILFNALDSANCISVFMRSTLMGALHLLFVAWEVSRTLSASPAELRAEGLVDMAQLFDQELPLPTPMMREAPWSGPVTLRTILETLLRSEQHIFLALRPLIRAAMGQTPLPAGASTVAEMPGTFPKTYLPESALVSSESSEEPDERSSGAEASSEGSEPWLPDAGEEEDEEKCPYCFDATSEDYTLPALATLTSFLNDEKDAWPSWGVQLSACIHSLHEDCFEAGRDGFTQKFSKCPLCMKNVNIALTFTSTERLPKGEVFAQAPGGSEDAPADSSQVRLNLASVLKEIREFFDTPEEPEPSIDALTQSGVPPPLPDAAEDGDADAQPTCSYTALKLAASFAYVGDPLFPTPSEFFYSNSSLVEHEQFPLAAEVVPLFISKHVLSVPHGVLILLSNALYNIGMIEYMTRPRDSFDGAELVQPKFATTDICFDPRARHTPPPFAECFARHVTDLRRRSHNVVLICSLMEMCRELVRGEASLAQFTGGALDVERALRQHNKHGLFAVCLKCMADGAALERFGRYVEAAHTWEHPQYLLRLFILYFLLSSGPVTSRQHLMQRRREFVARLMDFKRASAATELAPRPLQPFQFVALPADTSSLVKATYVTKRCPSCENPLSFADKTYLCLLTGRILCEGCRSPSLPWLSLYSRNPNRLDTEHHIKIAIQAITHAYTTRAVGAYLCLTDCRLIYVYTPLRICQMTVTNDSIYVDEYGDLDLGYSRGTLLTLSQPRLEAARQQVLTQIFPEL